MNNWKKLLWISLGSLLTALMEFVRLQSGS